MAKKPVKPAAKKPAKPTTSPKKSPMNDARHMMAKGSMLGKKGKC